MSKEVRFALVGYGHIGKRHAAMIRQHPQGKLVGVADCNPDLRDAVAQEEGVPFFESLDDMLAAELGAEVVNICTPNGLHASQAMKALEKQHHVVIEKPMALSKRDAEEVLHKALQVNRQVFCVMQNRYSPPSAWLKEVVADGRLGKIYLVEANCYWNRDSRYYRGDGWKGSADLDGGTLFTQFSHFVDIIYWLFGDITDIQAKFADFNHQGLTAFEDSGLVQFDFVKGGKGVFNYSTSVWDCNFESTLTILAEKGTVKVGGQYMDRVDYCHIEGYQMPELPPANPPNDYGHYKGSAANHHYVLENVIQTLNGGGVATTNALEGMKVVEIIERIYQLKTS